MLKLKSAKDATRVSGQHAAEDELLMLRRKQREQLALARRRKRKGEDTIQRRIDAVASASYIKGMDNGIREGIERANAEVVVKIAESRSRMVTAMAQAMDACAHAINEGFHGALHTLPPTQRVDGLTPENPYPHENQKHPPDEWRL